MWLLFIVYTMVHQHLVMLKDLQVVLLVYIILVCDPYNKPCLYTVMGYILIFYLVVCIAVIPPIGGISTLVIGKLIGNDLHNIATNSKCSRIIL